jgi:hypothetical protein
MCAVVSVVLPILESIAPHCALPSLFYLCEVAEDGSVLAGVEFEFPGDGVAVAPQRRFFWSVVWSACLDAYDQAVMQAIRFLQGLFGIYSARVLWHRCAMFFLTVRQVSKDPEIASLNNIGEQL